MYIMNTTAGENIKYKIGTGEYCGMPYINMRKNMKAVSMLQTSRMNDEGYTNKKLRMLSLRAK